MAQHAILRFEKHKGHPAGPLEAHHERKKEQYASNPDIDTSRSKYNFHIVKPDGRYYHFIQSRIEQARCRTRKDSTRFVDTLITASPEFFKGKSPKEIAAYFQRAADFLIDRVGRENIVSAMVHMDEKTPHLHLVFVPLTKDNRLCAKEIIGNRANLTKWQDDFHACMVEQYPDLERGDSAAGRLPDLDAFCCSGNAGIGNNTISWFSSNSSSNVNSDTKLFRCKWNHKRNLILDGLFS